MMGREVLHSRTDLGYGCPWLSMDVDCHWIVVSKEFWTYFVDTDLMEYIKQ